MTQGSATPAEDILRIVPQKQILGTETAPETEPDTTKKRQTITGDAAHAYFIDDKHYWQNRKTESTGTMTSETSDNDKYYEERFNRIDDKIEHQNEMFNSKIDRISDKMENLTDAVKETGAQVRGMKSSVITTAIVSVIALIVGLGSIVAGIAAMQNSWLQKYIELLVK